MGENDPKTISIEGSNSNSSEKEIITVYVKGQRFLVTPSEGLSIINQLSGVLMAYEYSGGRGESKKKYSI